MVVLMAFLKVIDRTIKLDFEKKIGNLYLDSKNMILVR